MTRVASLLLILLTVFVASRALIRSLPGDPLETVLAERPCRVIIQSDPTGTVPISVPTTPRRTRA